MLSFTFWVAAVLVQSVPHVTPIEFVDIIDNEQFRVLRVSWPEGAASAVDPQPRDMVTVYLDPATIRTTSVDGQSRVVRYLPGEVAFEPAGTSATEENISGHPVRAIAIELKDAPATPLSNTSGYPNAFPRPGVKTAFKNDRIVVWDYTWMPGVPTPTHFHDKYVVVVYLDDGQLRSTTPDQVEVVNEISFGLTTANPRARVHSEELAGGRARAIILELQ